MPSAVTTTPWQLCAPVHRIVLPRIIQWQPVDDEGRCRWYPSGIPPGVGRWTSLCAVASAPAVRQTMSNYLIVCPLLHCKKKSPRTFQYLFKIFLIISAIYIHYLPFAFIVCLIPSPTFLAVHSQNGWQAFRPPRHGISWRPSAAKSTRSLPKC